MKIYVKLIVLSLLCLFISAQSRIGGELRDAALENRAADPTSGNIPGRMYWHTGDNEMRVYNGSSYEALAMDDPDAVANAGTSTNNAVSRFDGATGKVVKDSNVTISDAGAMQVPAGTVTLPTVAVGAVDDGFYSEPTNNQSLTMVSGGVGRMFVTDSFFGLALGRFSNVDRVDHFTTAPSFTGNLFRHNSTGGTVLNLEQQDASNPDAVLLLSHGNVAAPKIRMVGGTQINIYNQSGGTNWDWTLPNDDGDANQFMMTNGSGLTSWEGIRAPRETDSLGNPCTDAESGKIIFNDDENWMCFCNGASYQRMHDIGFTCFP